MEFPLGPGEVAAAPIFCLQSSPTPPQPGGIVGKDHHMCIKSCRPFISSMSPVPVKVFLASSVFLGVFCVGVDYIIFQSESVWSSFPHGSSLRAVSDSLVHGIVGGWCWINVLLVTQAEWSWVNLGQVILCVTMAAGIDLDHMIEAGSFNIKVIYI